MSPATREPIHVPKEMVNDDSYRVLSLLAPSGQQVGKNTPLAELESSKASFTIHSPAAGFFYPDFLPGQMIGVGEVFGFIDSEPRREEDERTEQASAPQQEERLVRESRFSLSAWELFLESGLSLDAFSDFSHIKRNDVLLMMKQLGSTISGGDSLPALSTEEKQGGVVLLGGGGHARELVDIIELSGEWNIIGIVDTRSSQGDVIAGHPVLGDNLLLPDLLAAGIVNLILAYGISGSWQARGAHFRELLASGHNFPVLIHPQATVSRQAGLARGVQVMAGARIGSNANIGDACLVNTNAVVSHDCILCENVHIAPGAILAGGVGVGPDSVIGMGASVYMRVTIGKGVIVHNGAAVFADVPDEMEIRGEWRG